MLMHHRPTLLRIVYATSFFFALQIALTSYINSTFLSELVGSTFVGLIFTASAVLIIIGLGEMPQWLRAFGNRRVLLLLLIVNFITLLGITSFGKPVIQLISFLFYLATSNLIVFCFDIFIEHFSHNRATGRMRGLYLTTINAAWVLSPLLAGFFISQGGYHMIYGMAMAFVFVVFYLGYAKLKRYHDAPYKRLPLISTVKHLWHNHELRAITALNFVLQFFYAWMVIYMPIYLHNQLGFDWNVIGGIFTIMLLPFILLQLPLGRFADRHGEKKLLILGFFIMGIATLFLPFLPANPILWGIFLFFTRVGAATVEVMSEVYFFKHVSDSQSGFISIFRDTSPVAFIIAPLIGTVIVAVLSFKSLFFILGIFILTSLYYVQKLKDTKANY